MMEITKSNFEESFDQIISCIDKADFISLDLEMTGLGRKNDRRNTVLDIPEMRYRKTRGDIQEYGISQVGLSMFRLGEDKKYHNSTYCFYICGPEEATFKFDVSSMLFLAKQNFDFNKLFRDGMSYMSMLDEKVLREWEEKSVTKKKSMPQVEELKSPEAQQFVAKSIAAIQKAKESGENYIFENKGIRPFFYKLIRGNIAAEFPNAVFQSCVECEYDIEVVQFDSPEEKRTYQKEQHDKEFLKKVGFGRVFRRIMERGIPIVGHNIWLDLLHIIHKFVAPLPESFHMFKVLLRSNLSSVYDTKILSKQAAFSSIINTALANLHEELTTSKTFRTPDVVVEEGSQSYADNESGGQAHDAGYDAYMTGICFLTMVRKLEGQNWLKKDPLASAELKTLENKIHMMHTFDLVHMDLRRKDVIPDRSFIYAVDCPATWTKSDVAEVFQETLKQYKVVWENDTKLYVIPLNPATQNCKEAQKSLQAMSSPVLRITMYQIPRFETPKPVRNQSAKHELSESESASPDTGARELKRLKSVGASDLSKMTLNAKTQPGISQEFEACNNW